MKKKRIIFVSSSGGHFTQLLQLEKLFKKYEYMIITEKNQVVLSLLDKYNIKFLKYSTRKKMITFPFVFIYNSILSLYYIITFRPNFIISTGAGATVPICYIGKLLGKKIVFIESYARRNSKSLSGKLIYPISNLFIVQWDSMLELYPKAKCFGPIY